MISLGSLKSKFFDNYKKNELFCNLAILTILFFLNCFMGELSFVTFSFLLVCIIVSDMSNGFSYLVFTIPFCMIASDTSGFLYIATVATFMLKGYIRLLFIDKIKINKKIIVAFIAFVIYLLLPIDGIYGYNEQLPIKFVVIVGLILFAILMIHYPKEFRIKINVNICALALFISVIFFGTYFISDHLQSTIKLLYYGNFIRFQALLSNPNILAMISEICLALLVYFILSSKISWVEIVSFIIFTVLGFSTMSKTFLILLFIMFTILIVYFVIKKPFYGLCVITGISVVIVLLVAIKPQLFAAYLNRFVDIGTNVEGNSVNGALNHMTTGRYGLWIGYLQYMINYPYTLFFGATLGARQIGGESAHNIYISSLYQFGIIGSILFVLTLVFLCKDFKKRYPLLISKWIIVPIIIFAMIVCVEDLFMFIYV